MRKISPDKKGQKQNGNQNIPEIQVECGYYIAVKEGAHLFLTVSEVM
jgi:hypothetical protein